MSLTHLVIILLLVTLVVAWQVYLQPLLFRRPAPKGFDMTDDSTPIVGTRVIGGLTPSEVDQIRTRVRREEGAQPAWDVRSAPPERSVNDVHILRAQDQALAQLAAQYESMAVPPWRIVSPPLGSLAAAGPRTTIGRYTTLLGDLMMPAAAMGSTRGTSARETLYYIDVSPNKVWCKDEPTCKAMHAALNTQTLAALAVHRARLLDLIIASSLQPMEVAPDSLGFRVNCGQTSIGLLTEADAKALRDQLNVIYTTLVQPELDRVCAEIRAVAKGT